MSKINKQKLHKLYGLYVNCKNTKKRLELFRKIVTIEWSPEEILETHLKFKNKNQVNKYV